MSTTRVNVLTADIRLDQFLKWAGIAETGGQAKQLINSGDVCVNGSPERKRTRKLVPGDVIFLGTSPCAAYVIVRENG